MLGIVLTFALFALPGHLALCLWAGNNIDARIVHRGLKHCLAVPNEGWLILAPLVLATSFVLGYWNPGSWVSWQYLAAVYMAVATVVSLLCVPLWLYRRLTVRPPALLISNHTTTLDLAPRLEGRMSSTALGRLYLSVPGNESLQLAIHEKTIAVEKLPQALDGLTITNLSDLHFTGRVGKAYFQEVVQLANGLDSDLVAITGDLVDSAACIEWLPETLGQLRARHGVYFVLGNHDVRAGQQRVRQMLVNCGLTDVAGRWLRTTLRGQSVIIGGNELPWIKPVAEMGDCPASDAGGADFRILLSHSPDQHDWAQRHNIDLMLAGHTHGGQIQFPLIGPILAPSRYGVRYASGTFHLPPMVMHVSRGISGLQPLRFNCRPELARLVLRSQLPA